MKWLLAICLVCACKDKANVAPAAHSSPATAVVAPSDDELRTRNSLTMSERAGVFDLVDGAGKMSITLPNKPTLSGAMASQDGVEVFNAQAVMPGGAVDAQFGVSTVKDAELPAGMVGMLDGIPGQLAAATGGTLAKNESAVFLGFPARIFELTTPDGRRLFGWYVAVAAQARMYQLNCVGTDNPASRAACDTIIHSLKIK
ncbi:MAG: hypothetical protein JWO36_6279 [Myxococcales bacterium]|nr:hypothetical protein [Myxococcales bacterium]